MTVDREQENFVSRRSMLPIVAGALISAAVIPAVQAQSPDFVRLIAAHRAAEAAFVVLSHKQDEAESDYIEARTPITFSCLGAETILRPGMVGFEDCRNDIESWFQLQRRLLASLGDVAPREVAQMLVVLDSKEAESMALLDQAVERENAQRETFGLASIEREYRTVSDAEESAFMAICAYACRSAEECRLKAEYLLEIHELRDGFQMDHVRALLQSIAGGADV
jgi:hypothetical protein